MLLVTIALSVQLETITHASDMRALLENTSVSFDAISLGGMPHAIIDEVFAEFDDMCSATTPHGDAIV
eukprot:3621025-Amphidinium_carterae.1